MVAVVAIGRNEGPRLERCLRSAGAQCRRVVYVDSGSRDDSVTRARELGVQVIELDASRPFTAARGRNRGFEVLSGGPRPPRFVQFVDGDCGLVEGWIAAAAEYLELHPEAGVVFGRRREIRPGASVYNRLCDMEWDGVPGEVRYCGGDAMVRARAFRDAGGYDEGLAAGEDPEFSVRLRRRGWKIVRLDREMTRHDAAITRFGQWWRRTLRAGHAFAACRALHGSSPERFRVRETRSNWFWGLGLPALTLLAVAGFGAAGLLLLLGYPLLGGRIHRGRRRQGDAPRDAAVYATFCVLGKFPEMLGQALFHWRRWRGRDRRLIEYKGP
jgi:GT2 family glycosyltransferase